MDKLELKHIAPYIPYGLKCEQYGEAFGLRDWLGWGVEFKDKTGCVLVPLCAVKPILRPLSLLTKEIEHLGERFVPYDTNIFTKYRMNTLHPKHINIVGMPYWCVQKLIEWHFDVFGLIEKGLAVDATKLEGGA